jgi:hypothetical protein
MKKRNLKSLELNKKVISNFKNLSLAGGAVAITADVKDCPDNTLAADCGSLGVCPVSFWCPPIEYSKDNCEIISLRHAC